jgi:uncharacterized protein (DUF983 family)
MNEGEKTAKTARPDFLKTLERGLRFRCPVCGESNVFRAPFQVRHDCPACGALFQREAGFFVGAIMVNVVATEGAVMLAFGLCLLTLGGGGTLTLPVLFAVALLFPVLFYHHAWSLWLAGDHVVEGLPKQNGER